MVGAAVRSLVERLKAISSAEGKRRDRASILLPFLIISIGMGVLAYRSYQLAVRMELSVNTLAQKYAGYVSDITARRVDAAVGGVFSTAAEEWQQIERRVPSPNTATLQNWLNRNDWIVSAIYVPDYDPASSVFVSEPPNVGGKSAPRLTREFYTSSGTVRYTYDPARLLARVSPVLRQQPLVRAEGLEQQAHVTLVRNVHAAGFEHAVGGFAFVSPLGEPLPSYGVRAFVGTAYGSSGWENHRIISLWLCLIAFAFTSLGAYLAFRGVRKEAETMKLRGALIANVSHELRTPLSMIRLGAETLKRSSKLTEKQRLEIEDQILREVLHLSHLVENVLDVARIQHRSTKALAFTPVYPRELVTSLIATYESWIRSRGFNVTLQIDDAVEEQLWDREAVSRALLNLIDNAIKYSADEKSLAVALRQTPEHVVVEVKDRGIGIEPKEQQRIFDPYYRAQFSDTQTRRGAGLGLTLVQQIMLSHGGRIEVESEPGVGSTFRLLFPRGKGAATQPVSGLLHAPEAF